MGQCLCPDLCIMNMFSVLHVALEGKDSALVLISAVGCLDASPCLTFHLHAGNFLFIMYFGAEVLKVLHHKY